MDPVAWSALSIFFFWKKVHYQVRWKLINISQALVRITCTGDSADCPWGPPGRNQSWVMLGDQRSRWELLVSKTSSLFNHPNPLIHGPFNGFRMHLLLLLLVLLLLLLFQFSSVPFGSVQKHGDCDIRTERRVWLYEIERSGGGGGGACCILLWGFGWIIGGPNWVPWVVSHLCETLADMFISLVCLM